MDPQENKSYTRRKKSRSIKMEFRWTNCPTKRRSLEYNNGPFGADNEILKDLKEIKKHTGLA